MRDIIRALRFGLLAVAGVAAYIFIESKLIDYGEANWSFKDVLSGIAVLVFLAISFVRWKIIKIKADGAKEGE